MDILVKEGLLLLQGVKFGKKIWRKIWVMLFKPSQAGVGRIEMYDMREGAGVSAKFAISKKAEKRVIRLTECLSVTPALGESCPAGYDAFYLNTAQRIYTLAALIQDEWVPTLCSLAFQCNKESGEIRDTLGVGVDADVPMTVNDIYSTLSPGQFQVTVASTEASVRCCMSGSYLLSPEKESLCLLDMKTGLVAFHWPYRLLRRFGHVKEGISIEAGRRCQTGEGLFIFLSKQGQQIYRAIEEAIMHQSVQDLLSEATALPQDNMFKPSVPKPMPKPLPKPEPKREPKPMPVQNPVPMQTARPASPKVAICRKNLALPALPGPKPSVKIPEPDSAQAVYAKVKPLPKPRNIPTPPALPVPKLKTDPETKPNDLDIGDKEPDYDSCDWNQKGTQQQDSSISQLYSTVRPLTHTKKKPHADANQEHPKSSAGAPVFGSNEVPSTFKQMLSDVLFKDVTRCVPSPVPKSFTDSPDLLAEPDYYEIRK